MAINSGDDWGTIRDQLNAIFVTPPSFDTVQQLLASTASTFGGAGAIIEAGGFRYEVAATGAADHHLTTAGGVKLYVLRGPAGGVSGKAFDDDLQTPFTSEMVTAGASLITIPEGRYSVTDRLVLSQFRGGTLSGVGNGGNYRDRVSKGYGHRQPQTIFLWDGADGGTLMEVAGGAFFGISGFDFEGKDSADRTKTAALLLFSDEAGWASGQTQLDRLSFHHATTGIQCGEASGDSNCSDLICRNIHGNNLDNLLLVNNDQGLNYLFDYVVCGESDTIFNLERGGSLRAAMVTGAGTDWVLRMGRSGRNVGVVKLDTVRVENNGVKRAGMIYTDSAAPYTVNAIIEVTNYISNGETGANNNTPLAATFLNELHRGVKVTYRSSLINGHNFANLTSPSAILVTSIVMDRCQFYENNFNFANWFTKDANSFVAIRDCIDALGRIVRNSNDNIVNGFTATVSASTSYSSSTRMPVNHDLSADRNKFYPGRPGYLKGLTLTTSTNLTSGTVKARIMKNGNGIAATEVTISSGAKNGQWYTYTLLSDYVFDADDFIEIQWETDASFSTPSTYFQATLLVDFI